MKKQVIIKGFIVFFVMCCSGQVMGHPVSQMFSTRTVLYDNGPLVTTPGGGYSGADISELQTTLGMNTLGIGCQIINGYRVADDFEVTSLWNIDAITFFAYQTGTYGYPPNSTLNELNVRIWDGPPNDPGSAVIWGDTTTDRLSGTDWSGIYRVTDTTQTETNRPIMSATCTVSLTLFPGTYWLDWSIGGSLASGPWQPPITIFGQTSTGNAFQYTTSWSLFVDTGTGTQQGLPFVIEGTLATPSDDSLYSIRETDYNLVSIDPVTFTLTVVGPTGFSDGEFGGLAYDPVLAIMYWIPGRFDTNLYRLNLSTGQATLIGAHNVTDLFGLAYDSLNGVLYATQFSTQTGLYTLNTANGSATLIGTMLTGIGGLAYNSLTDDLVGIQDGTGRLYSINRSTAELTLIHDGPGTNDSGLEYDPVRNYYWNIDWNGDLSYYDIDNGYMRTVVLSGLDPHSSLAMVTGASPTPTPFPTMPPTHTPTPLPPTPTPDPDCSEMGCDVYMPFETFGAGDECYCEVYVCNTDDTTYTDIPVFVILDVYGMLFFAPSFGDFDSFNDPIPPGRTTIQVLPSFPWPEDVGSTSGIIWYAAMTNPEITQLHGKLGTFTFGWH